MSENLPKQEVKKDSLLENIEASASPRADFSRRFLKGMGKSLSDFAEEIKKPPFEITVNSEDDKSLAVAIFQLQKKMGFPEKDGPRGCDGKFGPYTKRAYEGFGVKKTAVSKRSAEADSAVFDSTVSNGVVYSDVAREPKSVDTSENFTPTKISETVFIGDSLTVGMARAGGINGAIKLYKGGSSSYTRLKALNEFLASNKQAIDEKRIKKVVIAIGTNDITNFRGRLDTVEAIIGRLNSMFNNVRDAGLSLVVCTIPYSVLSKRLAGWQKVHGSKYPYDLAALEQRVDQVNDFIRSQAGGNIKVVDLYEATKDQSVYALGGDGLHHTSRGAAALARKIRDDGEIA